ncbi:MAG: DUF4105 domain-containing protein [Akkermansiaceae bacterium]
MPLTSRCKRYLRPALLAVARLCQLAVVIWSALSLYWFVVPLPWLQVLLSAGFLALALTALFFRPSPRLFKVLSAAVLLVLVGWIAKRPTHAREWRPEMAVMPSARIDGDEVTLHHVRDFNYRSKSDFDVRYEDREIRLSDLQSVDFLVSHWSSDAVAHTFVSFNFGNAEPVCISIEARLEMGETYSPVASCFKEAELIYIVGSERDLIRVRTDFRDEKVYLYRTRATPAVARRLFLSYLEKINELAAKPEFYHLLSNNCTVNILRHTREEGTRGEFDMRILLNGYVDGYAYTRGALDTTMPFAELRAASLVSPTAAGVGEARDFSSRIRAHLPAAP